MIRECMSAKAGLRGLIDLYLNAECIKASLKLRQPHHTHINDDGVLPPLVAIAQSPRVNNALLDAALRARNCVRTCYIVRHSHDPMHPGTTSGMASCAINCHTLNRRRAPSAHV